MKEIRIVLVFEVKDDMDAQYVMRKTERIADEINRMGEKIEREGQMDIEFADYEVEFE